LEADYKAEMNNMEEEEKKAQDQDCTSEVGQENQILVIHMLRVLNLNLIPLKINLPC
jgi:hypothetical protein